MKPLQWIIGLCVIQLLIACSTGFPGQQSCDELPSVEAIRHALEQHASIRAQVEQLNPNAIVFVIEENKRCPDRATLVIYHVTTDEGMRIRKLLGESFFGIPYELRNV